MMEISSFNKFQNALLYYINNKRFKLSEKIFDIFRIFVMIKSKILLFIINSQNSENGSFDDEKLYSVLVVLFLFSSVWPK